VERILQSNDWFTLSLVAFLLALTILKQSNKGKYARLISFKYIDYYWMNNNIDRRFISYFEMIAYAISHIIVSQAIFVLIDGKLPLGGVNLNALEVFIVIFFATLLFSIVKFNLEKFLNFSTNKEFKYTFYIYYKQFIWVYALLLGLPFLILDMYIKSSNIPFIYVFLVVSIGFALFRLIVFGYKNSRFVLRHWFYFILYLCTLEIAPYFFIYKVFINK
jgi:hypothetical protein